MPELPEVETVKNVLKPYLVGRTITDILINNSSVIAHPSAEQFIKCLHKQTFADITRQGKFLTFYFASGDNVILHLRMTGCLTIEQKGKPYEKHTHVIFMLNDGNELRYEDIRRFGKFWYIESNSYDTFSGKNKLGLEPFDITIDYLRAKFLKSKKPLKTLLLDQTIISGIGNIYSDEICFAAKILPYRTGNSLTEEELLRLSKIMPYQITYFIEKNKITFEEYAKAKGKEYRNTPYLNVYGKSKKPCPICQTLLNKKTIGGRSSVYCPQCQK